MGVGGSTISPLEEEDETKSSAEVAGVAGATLVRIGIFQVNPVTKTGSLIYIHLRVVSSRSSYSGFLGF